MLIGLIEAYRGRARPRRGRIAKAVKLGWDSDFWFHVVEAASNRCFIEYRSYLYSIAAALDSCLSIDALRSQG